MCQGQTCRRNDNGIFQVPAVDVRHLQSLSDSPSGRFFVHPFRMRTSLLPLFFPATELILGPHHGQAVRTRCSVGRPLYTSQLRGRGQNSEKQRRLIDIQVNSCYTGNPWLTHSPPHLSCLKGRPRCAIPSSPNPPKSTYPNAQTITGQSPLHFFQEHATCSFQPSWTGNQHNNQLLTSNPRAKRSNRYTNHNSQRVSC